jgi:hypothetical protein
MPVVGALYELVAVFHVATCWMRSWPLTTERSPFSITHFETNAPFPPCARTIPDVFWISWFTSRVNVPLPLSNAPSPSGIPTSL